MATLEDKILGEKLHNYCSSSEESDRDNSDSEDSNRGKGLGAQESSSAPEVNKWEGTSTNTGPKGVIKDWEQYKKLETQKRKQDEVEKIELAKKLTLTVQSALDEERAKAKLDDPELAELLDDEFLLDYQKKRMQEMLQQTNHNIKFGNLIMLRDGNEFLDAIDKEHKSVTVIVHIYEDNVEACRTMNACLSELSKIHSNVKFCAIVGSRAGISRQFKVDGVPALLIYKAGQVVGNFIRMTDELGPHFCMEDVENFLVEHGMIEDKSCKPVLVRSASISSDSD